MKVYYKCGACFLRQAKEAMELATNDNELKIDIMEEIFDFLAENYTQYASSNKLGSVMHCMIKEKTGCPDPYLKEKDMGNKIALEFLPMVEKLLEEANTIENYIKIAIVGNILDFGALGLDFDPQEFIFANLNKKLAINHIDQFKEAISNHENVLFLADNTGEIVFDKLFIEKLNELGLNVTVALKEKPSINDACIEDAKSIDLDQIATLTTLGADSVGIVYDELSDEFKNLFDKSNFIIAKGLGNYEGLTEINLNGKDVFSLFCVKCSAISKDIGIDERENILLKL